MLDQQTLMLQVHYDPETGEFTWNIGGRKKVAYARAGSLDGKGYWRIMIDGVDYRAHRLAWLYMTGRWPVQEVDHKNRNRTDNRWANLREATAGEQRQNQGLRSDATSGFRGVTYLPAKNKWLARIAMNRRRKHLGLHDTVVDAVAARITAERVLFTHSPVHFNDHPGATR